MVGGSRETAAMFSPFDTYYVDGGLPIESLQHSAFHRDHILALHCYISRGCINRTQANDLPELCVTTATHTYDKSSLKILAQAYTAVQMG